MNKYQNGIDGSWERGEKTWTLSFFSAYPLFIFLGIATSLITIYYFWRRQKYSLEILQILIIIVIPSGILGARLWWVISTSSWADWYKINNGGLAIQGGIMIGASCGALYIWSKRSIVDFRTVAGIIIPSVLIGQAIGRWGNFNNHEVYGAIVQESQLDWLGSWLKSHMFIEGEYRQPFFLYESFANFWAYVFIILVLLRKNWVKPGTTAALYFVWYGIVRLIMEPLRDSVDIMKPFGDFEMSTFISVMWILLGLIFVIYLEVLTMPSEWVKKVVPSIIISKKEYEIIKPVKPRKKFWFGQISETKKKYLFWGEEISNKIKIFLPIQERKWSKREINAGKKFKK